MKSISDKLSGAVGSLRLPDLPKLGRDVELPVYIIHNSPDPEDYFFIFDFEDFVEQSRDGFWVRPKLRLWAGRSDFQRRLFARQFRETFAREFDLARAELASSQDVKGGWFGGFRGVLKDLAAPSVPGVLGNLVLLVALSAGSAVLGRILPSSWTGQKTDTRKLEDGIQETKDKVDLALSEIKITLHMDLYRHAYRGEPPGRLTGMDYDAWPLPAYVTAHLEDGKSGAWW